MLRRLGGLELAIELNCANRVLVGKLCQHLLNDHVDLMLVAPEVVEQAVKRRVRDLQLRRSQLEVIVDRLHRAILEPPQPFSWLLAKWGELAL